MVQSFSGSGFTNIISRSCVVAIKNPHCRDRVTEMVVN